MSRTRKITVEIPEGLIRKAQKASGTGLTATVRTGLELLAAQEIYQDLRALKGKVQFTLDLTELRRDRR